MTDFAAAGPAQEFHFAHRKRREIVVQHEALERFVLEEQIEALHVFLGAERERGQSLGLAASEKRRTVHARQQAHFAGDLANLVEGAAIGTAACEPEYRRGKYFSRRRSKARLASLRLSSSSSGMVGQDLFLDGIDQRDSFPSWDAWRCPARRAGARRTSSRSRLRQRFVERQRRHCTLCGFTCRAVRGWRR